MLKQEFNEIDSMLRDFGLKAKAKEESAAIIEFAELPTTTYEQARRKVMNLYNAIYMQYQLVQQQYKINRKWRNEK